MLNFSMKLQARKVANNKGDKRMRTDDGKPFSLSFEKVWFITEVQV